MRNIDFFYILSHAPLIVKIINRGGCHKVVSSINGIIDRGECFMTLVSINGFTVLLKIAL